ncbi:hypothetical protein C8Q79DRAFT_21379 [Trametes meyenii]|nr:hypothetical protein C8Q79DRAFT_21379 [Trametes meyenii]
MPLLGDTVEASREKRIERQQARFRDRGGIFKPAEHNALLDILLSRGVNGESPSRANSPRRSRSRSISPTRKVPTMRSATAAPKSRVSKKKPRKSEAKKHVSEAPAKANAHTEIGSDGLEAGPSRPAGGTKVGKESAKPATKQAVSHTGMLPPCG